MKEKKGKKKTTFAFSVTLNTKLLLASDVIKKFFR